MLASIAYVIEITTFPMILSGLSSTLALDDRAALWLVSAYKVALVGSLLVGGWLGDRWSREGVFAVGTGIFCVSALAVLFAQNGDQALVFRILQGVGAGLFSPMVPALLAARKPHDPIAALGIWGMLTGAAAAVYPFLAALLTEQFSWHVGWMMVPAAAALALLGLPSRSDQSVPTSANSTDVPAGVERLNAGVWSILLYVFLNYGMTTWFIYALALSFDTTESSFTDIGALLFLLWAVFSLSNYVIAKIGRRVSVTAMLYLGVIANLAGIALFYGADGQMLYWAMAAALVGFGMALNNAPTTDMAFRLSPKRLHGRVASFDIVAARLGGAAFVMVVPMQSIYGIYAALAATALSIGLTVYSGHAKRQSLVIA